MDAPTREQLALLRRDLKLATAELLAADQPEADLALAEVLAALRDYCLGCFEMLDDPDVRTCPSCGAVREAAVN